MTGSMSLASPFKCSRSTFTRRSNPSSYSVGAIESGPLNRPPRFALAALAPARRPTNLRVRYAANSTQKVTTEFTSQKLTHFGYRTDFDNKFTIGNKLGSGSFGTVHEAIENSTGYKYAVKTIPKRFMAGYLEQHFVRRVQHEVDIYTTLGRSLNVCTLHSVYENELSVDIVTELCAGGELWQRLVRHGKYEEPDAAFIITRVLQTIAQCHAKGVVLRDVKPDNFLFLYDSEDAPLKMIDFGLSEWCGPDDWLSDRAGTTWYLAPEVLRQCYSQKCDLWSAGILAYEVLLGQMPYRDEDGGLLAPTLMDIHSDKILGKDVFRGILTLKLDRETPPLNTLSDGAFNFLNMLLTKDPEERPTALEALEHPWLRTARAASDQPTPQVAHPTGRVVTAWEAAQLLDGSLVQRLQRYGTYGLLKKVALRKVATVVADHEFLVSKEKAVFDFLAGGGDTIPFQTIVNTLNSGAFSLRLDESEQLCEEFQQDANKGINYEEFLAAMLDWESIQRSSLWNSWVLLAFHQLDTHHLGRLSKLELEEAMCEEECPMEDTVPAAMRMADHTSVAAQNGGSHAPNITMETFAKMMYTSESDKLSLFESRLVHKTHQ